MLGWYFAPENRKLRYGDNRVVKAGVTHTVDCEASLCLSGLHWSKRAIDALKYAPGPVACRVEGGGTIIEGDNKIVGTSRKYLAVADATDVLRRLARKWALDVIHLWDTPQAVKDYLETGDENLAYAAYEATTLAARAAYARSAFDAAHAAILSARASCARTTYIACTATHLARVAASDAAVAMGGSTKTIRDQQNTELEKALFELLGLE